MLIRMIINFYFHWCVELVFGVIQSCEYLLELALTIVLSFFFVFMIELKYYFQKAKTKQNKAKINFEKSGIW